MHRPFDHGYQRLRAGRHSETGRVYLVTTVVRNRDPVSRHWLAAQTCANILHNVPRNAPVTTVAWVVMPDHVHWLLQLNQGDLAGVVRDFKSRAGRRVNGLLDRTSPFWQPGFHDRAVRWEEDVRALARYVVANPLRAGLCEQIGDYPYWNAIWLESDPGNALDL